MREVQSVVGVDVDSPPSGEEVKQAAQTLIRHFTIKRKAEEMAAAPSHIKPAAFCMVSGPSSLQFEEQTDKQLSEMMMQFFNARHQYL